MNYTDTWLTDTTWNYVVRVQDVSGEPSLEEKLDALMEHLGLEFKKVPEKLEIKEKSGSSQTKQNLSR